MKLFRLAMALAVLVTPACAFLARPVYAQTPSINLLPELPSKTPEEKEADQQRDKAYKESLKKIPDAKASSDPWGGVRSSDAPKAATSGTKAAASTKKTKTGSNAN